MHQWGWAHLDIKPEDFLLFEVQGRLALKVADLGLARAMTPATGLCNAGQRCGAPQVHALLHSLHCSPAKPAIRC
jgi:serine/threonine protein kinase